MRIIIHYLGINLIKAILGVTVLLLGVDLFFYFINELRFIGIGNYTFGNSCIFILLTIPRKLYIIAPWSVFIGTLIALGNMAKYRELLFMRAIGLSIHKISLCVGVYLLGFTIFISILGEILAPKIEFLAQKKKTLALSKGNAIYTSAGTWIRHNNRFIHVSRFKDHNTLKDVSIYELDDNFKLTKHSFAETVKLIDPKIGKNIKSKVLWELQHVTLTDVTTTNSNYDGLAVPKITLDLKSHLVESDLLDLNLLKATNVKHLERLSILNLYHLIKERAANHLGVIDYKIAYWKKLTHPLVILIAGYLATQLIFGPLSSCARSTNILAGLIIGIIFYLLNAILHPLITVIGFSPEIAVMLPPAGLLSIAIYLALKI